MVSSVTSQGQNIASVSFVSWFLQGQGQRETGERWTDPRDMQVTCVFPCTRADTLPEQLAAEGEAGIPGAVRRCWLSPKVAEPFRTAGGPGCRLPGRAVSSWRRQSVPLSGTGSDWSGRVPRAFGFTGPVTYLLSHLKTSQRRPEPSRPNSEASAVFLLGQKTLIPELCF